MTSLRLEELSEDTLPAVLKIPPQPGEKAYVAPVAWSIAQAYVTPTAWPRVIRDGDEVVGFVMANWDPDNEVEAFRAGIWRLNVTDAAKGRGVGRFAVEQVAAEARRRGVERITVLWNPAEDGPEGFYLRVGFEKVGEMYGETVGALTVS
jgi:diamine N-acetyltransferase